MRCPVCGSYEQSVLSMKSKQFAEGLVECAGCGSSWSINHGHSEMVADAHPESFVAGQTECVEADDYVWAA